MLLPQARYGISHSVLLHAQQFSPLHVDINIALVLQENGPRRVVVTGMGVVSCLGHELDEFYNNLLAGKSGISMIEVSVGMSYTVFL